MAMESNLNVLDPLYDDIDSDSSPYFLESPPIPASTAFEYVSNSGVLPGSEGMQGGLDDSFEGIASISFDDLHYQETFVARGWNGLPDEQLDMQTELPDLFNMDQTGTQSATGSWYSHDNLDDPSSVLTGLHTSTNDESIQSPSQESSPTVKVRNEQASRRERHPRMQGGYQCDLCAKKFNLHRDLKRHKRHHLRNFKCDQCPATFAFKKDLDRHIGCVHDCRRSYICSECNKGFGRKDNMRRHRFRAHRKDIS